MLLYVAAFAVVCLWGVKVKAKNKDFFEDYMSPEKTTAIKGIFIIIVFFSHFNSYADFTWSGDLFYERIVKAIGQWMVTLFMFYSGYGVAAQIDKKGEGYIRSMPVKRILSLIFKFDTAVIIFTLIKLILNEKIKGTKFLLSLTGWESMGNSNWYIFDILLLYAITYIAFRFIKDKKYYIVGSALVALLSMGYILLLAKTDIKDYWWYDTVLCYSAGMFWFLWRKPLEKLIADKTAVWLLIFVIFAAASILTNKYDQRTAVKILSMLCFTALVVVATMRISFCNKALVWCGKHLFEIYILQRIPMKLLGRVDFISRNTWLYFALCFAFTAVAAIAFSKLTDKLWKKLCSVFSKEARSVNY